jgi:hypothetical protein
MSSWVSDIIPTNKVNMSILLWNLGLSILSCDKNCHLATSQKINFRKLYLDTTVRFHRSGSESSVRRKNINIVSMCILDIDVWSMGESW